MRDKRIKIFSSVRARLALWSTSVFALVLIVFAVSAYAFLAHTLENETNATLAFMASEFAASFAHEAAEHPQESVEWAANSGATLFGERYRDFSAVIYNPRQNKVFAFVEHATGRANPPGQSALTGIARAIGDEPGGERRVFGVEPNGDSGTGFFAGDFTVAGEKYVIVVAQPLTTLAQTLRQARAALLIGTPLALLLAGCGGYFMARKTLSPVVVMSDRADEIQAANLHRTRLPIANPQDELGHLAQTFNRLLERLDLSMELQRQFMAEASHELRTPISIVRCESEVTLGKPHRTEDEYRESFRVIGDESRRMTRIVEDLFLIARADAGQYPLIVSSFYLEETLAECARALKKLAQMRGVEISVPANAELPFRGDETLIRRAFLNLLDNAVKHTPPGGTVRVEIVAANEKDYQLIFADTGAGINPADQPRIFERFFRGEKRQASRSPTGAGLGLSIVKWACEINGGSVELLESSANGSIFRLTLPAGI